METKIKGVSKQQYNSMYLHQNYKSKTNESYIFRIITTIKLSSVPIFRKHESWDRFDWYYFNSRDTHCVAIQMIHGQILEINWPLVKRNSSFLLFDEMLEILIHILSLL